MLIVLLVGYIFCLHVFWAIYCLEVTKKIYPNRIFSAREFILASLQNTVFTLISIIKGIKHLRKLRIIKHKHGVVTIKLWALNEENEE